MKKNLQIGIDVGNGYVKCQAADENDQKILIDMPSAVSFAPVQSEPMSADQDLMEDLENNLEARIESPAIDKNERLSKNSIYFGTRAGTGEDITEFDITDFEPKCDNPLSIALILGSVASAALRFYYSENGTLPDSLDVNASLGTALPFSDFNKFKTTYREKLESGKHIVTVMNFEKEIPVTISFGTVLVMPEGAAAQHTIKTFGAPMLNGILADERKKGAVEDDGVTGEILTEASSILGIDIGEGTTNFPLIINGKRADSASGSINKGFGTIIEGILARHGNDKGFGYDNRKEIVQMLLKKSKSPKILTEQKRIEEYMEEAIPDFMKPLEKYLDTVMRKYGSQIEVIYVYGGGSIKLKNLLLDKLKHAIAKYTTDTPIIYMTGKYARDLNRTGLYAAVRQETAKNAG